MMQDEREAKMVEVAIAFAARKGALTSLEHELRNLNQRMAVVKNECKKFEDELKQTVGRNVPRRVLAVSESEVVVVQHHNHSNAPDYITVAVEPVIRITSSGD